jgi:outer membrane beta-barrel protein
MPKQLLLIVAILAVAGTAAAEEYEEGGKLYAVQGRRYVDGNEFTLALGVAPMDAFYKGVTGTFAYTYHFDDLWAWEIVSGTYSLNVDTDLRKKLQTEWGVEPTEFPQLSWIVDSNAVLKPFYGKLSVLNDSLIYTELYFVAGAAVGRYEGGKQEGNLLPSTATTSMRYGPDLGLGLRFYLSKSFSLRFDFRDYYLLNGNTSGNELLVQAGLGLNIR